jgi:hypothetical protein
MSSEKNDFAQASHWLLILTMTSSTGFLLCRLEERAIALL